MEFNQYYEFSLKIAKKAGTILLQHYQKNGLHISYKDHQKRDLVTEADRLTEKYIVDSIKKKFPNHDILGEEGGKYEKKNSQKRSHRWIIDPLDGTTNYAHGHSFFAVSIALEIDGEIVLGIVNAPKLKEFFCATKGGGAFLNNKKIHVSKVKTLEEALLTTGFGYQGREKNLPYFTNFVLQTQGMRRCGSAAIDLAYVATGRFDGFWEFGLKPWDVAAGKLIVEEAGGKATNMDGSRLILDGENILAANADLYPKMLKDIRATTSR